MLAARHATLLEGSSALAHQFSLSHRANTKRTVAPLLKSLAAGQRRGHAVAVLLAEVRAVTGGVGANHRVVRRILELRVRAAIEIDKHASQERSARTHKPLPMRTESRLILGSSLRTKESQQESCEIRETKHSFRFWFTM